MDSKSQDIKVEKKTLDNKDETKVDMTLFFKSLDMHNTRLFESGKVFYDIHSDIANCEYTKKFTSGSNYLQSGEVAKRGEGGKM